MNFWAHGECSRQVLLPRHHEDHLPACAGAVIPRTKALLAPRQVACNSPQWLVEQMLTFHSLPPPTECHTPQHTLPADADHIQVAAWGSPELQWEDRNTSRAAPGREIPGARRGRSRRYVIPAKEPVPQWTQSPRPHLPTLPQLKPEGDNVHFRVMKA